MRQYDLSLWVIPFTGKKHNSSVIAEFIIDRIQNRVVLPYESIPSHRTLASLNKVNRNTALRAYTKLIGAGWLIHRRGGKACVADSLPGDRYRKKPLLMPEILPGSFPMSEERDMDPKTEKHQSFISIGIPLIDMAYSPVKLLAKYMREGITDNSGKIRLQKTIIENRQTLQDAILYHLNLRKFNIRTDHLLVIRGRNECLRCIFKALSIGKDTIINTAPSDMAINLAIKDCGIPMTGLNAAASDFLLQLEELAQKIKVRAVYIRSNCSFPECRGLDEATCFKLVALAKKHHFYIIEEDDDHEFWWGKSPFKPLAHYDHGGFVIYCAALSRVNPYMQHLRTVVAPAQLVKRLKIMPDSIYGYRDFSEEKAIIRLLFNHELVSFSRRARLAKLKDLKNVQDILQLQLGEYISYDLPECGTGLWISFPTKVNLVTVFEILKNDGYQMRISNNIKTDKMVNHMRLDFGRFNERECRQAAIRLRSLLKKGAK
jgi:GntR family transcriptional regulator/MocR family aminotransferase